MSEVRAFDVILEGRRIQSLYVKSFVKAADSSSLKNDVKCGRLQIHSRESVNQCKKIRPNSMPSGIDRLAPAPVSCRVFEADPSTLFLRRCPLPTARAAEPA